MFISIDKPGNHGINGTVNVNFVDDVGCLEININVLSTNAPTIVNNEIAHHFKLYKLSSSVIMINANTAHRKPVN